MHPLTPFVLLLAASAAFPLTRWEFEHPFSPKPKERKGALDLDPARTAATASTKEPKPNDPNPYPEKPSQPDGFYGPYWTGAGFPGGKVPKGYATEQDWWHYKANVENGSLPKDASFDDYFVARAKGKFGPVNDAGDAVPASEKGENEETKEEDEDGKM